MKNPISLALSLVIIYFSSLIMAFPQSEFLELQKVLSQDADQLEEYGYSVAISEDVAIVGSKFDDQKGMAYIYKHDGSGNWEIVKSLDITGVDVGDEFGFSVAISGNIAVVGAPESFFGAAYIYQRDFGGSDNWGQVLKIVPGDLLGGEKFGHSVAVNNGVAIIGAPQDDDQGMQSGSTYAFSKDVGGENNWGQVSKLTATDGDQGDNFGHSVAISDQFAVVGAHLDEENGQASGSAYIFDVNNWGELSKIKASDGQADDGFGWSVATDGDFIAVGAKFADENGSNSGAAYLFYKDAPAEDKWGQVKKLIAPDGTDNDFLGNSIALDRDIVIIGAPNDNFGRGAAYVFKNIVTASSWVFTSKIIANNGIQGMKLGSSVAISQDMALVGVPEDDINGPKSGSAYFFEACYAPYMVLQPESVHACQGQNINFIAAAQGSGPHIYQWKRNGALLSNQVGKISGANEAILIIDDIEEADEAQYTCEITGPCGESINSQAAFLNVTIPPRIKFQSENQHVCEGEKALLSISAVGETLTYQWQKNNEDIDGATNSFLEVSETDLNAHVITSFTCIVTSTCGLTDTSDPIEMTLAQKPEITLQPADADKKTGEQVTFEVSATGTGHSYQWLKDGFALVESTDITGVNQTQLTITSLDGSHSGFYSCAIDNGCSFAVLSDAARLSVDGIIAAVDQDINESTQVYPNPNQGTFIIQLDYSGENKVSVIDALGRVIWEESFRGKEMKIEIPHIRSGIYYVKIRHNDTILTRKMLVQ